MKILEAKNLKKYYGSGDNQVKAPGIIRYAAQLCLYEVAGQAVIAQKRVVAVRLVMEIPCAALLFPVRVQKRGIQIKIIQDLFYIPCPHAKSVKIASQKRSHHVE